MQQVLDLGEARVDPDDDRRPFGEQVVAEAAAAIHLDEQPADVAKGVVARFQERATFAPEHSRVWAARSDPCVVGCAPAPERGHPGRV